MYIDLRLLFLLLVISVFQVTSDCFICSTKISAINLVVCTLPIAANDVLALF